MTLFPSSTKHSYHHTFPLHCAPSFQGRQKHIHRVCYRTQSQVLCVESLIKQEAVCRAELSVPGLQNGFPTAALSLQPCSIKESEWINSELEMSRRYMALVSWQPCLSYFMLRMVSDGQPWKLSSSLQLDWADSPMHIQLRLNARFIITQNYF